MIPDRHMHWFRWHHGTVSDPKWRVIARKSNVSVGLVIGIWATICEIASQAETRGTVMSWDPEDVAELLSVDVQTIADVWGAMQGKVLKDSTLTGWFNRNPLREDDLSTDRVRRFRDRQKSTSDQESDIPVTTEKEHNETQRNATKRNETTETPDERRVDKRKENKKRNVFADSGIHILTSVEQEILDYYHAKHPRRKTDPGKARRYIASGLKHFSPDQLKQAIDGNAKDEWHTKHRKHELSYVLRDQEHISKFLDHPRCTYDEHGEPTPETLAIWASWPHQ